MSRRKNQHVVPNGPGWAVRGANNRKNTAVTKIRSEAIRIGKRIAKNQKSELYIHKRDGIIEERFSYGNDPYPPKG